MREIKFRAWLPTEKRMTFTHSLKEIVSICSLGYPDSAQWMQYAGFKDKEGKEVYEDDIVEAWSAGSKGIFQVKFRQEGAPMWLLYPNYQDRQHWNIHVTEYGNGKILMDVTGSITGKDKHGFYDTGLQVIGNIHEHPNLLIP